MTEEDKNLPPQSPENKAYYDEFFRLKYRVVLLALKTAEWFYDGQVRERSNTPPEVDVAYEAIDDEFEDAVREFAFFMIRPVPE